MFVDKSSFNFCFLHKNGPGPCLSGGDAGSPSNFYIASVFSHEKTAFGKIAPETANITLLILD